LWVRDTGGRPIASAGFACSLRDLARFGLLIGKAVCGVGPAPLVKAARSIAEGGNRVAFARSGQPTRPGYSYRSGWWIDHHREALNALGVFGQRLHVVPSAELVIARFGSSPTASNQPTDTFHAEWFGAIRAALDAR
jgi:CubicO group peptidase (beta-lactamase class C family)